MIKERLVGVQEELSRRRGTKRVSGPGVGIQERMLETSQTWKKEVPLYSVALGQAVLESAL